MQVLSWLERAEMFFPRSLFAILVVAGALAAPGSAAAEATIPTTSTINCGTAVRFPGESVGCQVRVRSSGTGATAPTGNVKLTAEGGQMAPTCSLPLLPLGVESFCEQRYKPQKGGLQTITVSYPGDQTHLPSSGKTTIAISDTVTTLTCPESFSVSKPASCTAEVHNAGAASDNLSGTLSFELPRGGKLEPSSCNVAESSVCTLKFSAEIGDSYVINATYGGDATHPASKAQALLSGREASATTVDCGSTVRFPGDKVECLVKTNGFHSAPNHADTVVPLTVEGREVASCLMLTDGGVGGFCSATFAVNEPGSQTVTASYPGDVFHLPSSGNTTVTVSDTATRLKCQRESFVLGESAVCTAEVKNTGGASDNLSGTLSFKTNLSGRLEPSGCNVSESHSCTVNFIPTVGGVQAITATYEGDATHPASHAEATLTVRSVTETTMDCGPELRFFGEQIKCLAKVKGIGQGATAPTGVVAFNAGSEAVALCLLVKQAGAESACTGTYTPKATLQKLVATYGGDRLHASSIAKKINIVVSDTATTMTCQPTSLFVGEASVCTAEVRNTGPASDSLAGTLSFESNHEGRFEPSSCNVAETRVCKVKYFPGVGAEHRILAAYGGDPTHPASRANAILAVRGTSVKLQCTQETEAVFEPTTNCIAHVVNEGLGPTTDLGGSVRFTSDSGRFSPPECVLVAAAVDGAFCSTSYTSEAAGVNLIRAFYSGDGVLPPAIDGESQLKFQPNPTTTTFACASLPLEGESITCVARVRDSSPKAGAAPTGPVVFSSEPFKGQFTDCSQLTPINSVESTCMTVFHPEISGTHTLNVEYRGDRAHTGSEASAHLIPHTTTTVDCGDTSTLGALNTCTATVRAVEGLAAPNGRVQFTSSALGEFGGPDCELKPIAPDASACSLSFKPLAETTHTITATYGGSSLHLPSVGTKNLIVRSG
jgi:hypothetical protein